MLITIALLTWLAAFFALAGNAWALEPVVFTVHFRSPTSHVAEVEAVIPAAQRDSIELMMPVWTPGYYRVENYAERVQDFAAHGADGTALEVERPQSNRWRIRTGRRRAVAVSYRLSCQHGSVTGNWVGTNFAVLNGPATFPALVERARRPYEVRLELPSGWDRAMTALDAAPDGLPNHFRATDYDTLADAPIVAGPLSVREFTVAGSRHFVVDAGDVGQWDGARAARDLEKIVRENRRFWGELPFKHYVFLNVFRRGGGGLEHKNSTLLTSSPGGTNSTRGYASWLAFVCHEYVHAFNVKRLRPAEFEPIDYEKPPHTGSLWVSEGLTTYYGELLAVRAGVRSPRDFLAWLSSEIKRLQSSPGRLAQSLEQASLEVWNTPASGLPSGASTNTVSYYVKGPIVGFLLDAKVQRATNGKKSLDDVMRLAYRRYSGQRGFTPEQFRETAEQVAGINLRDWFQRAISSMEELDYTEALDWFGLQFGPPEDTAKKWKLEPRAAAATVQEARWQRLTGASAPLSAAREPLRVFIRSGAKTHGPGMHDHPKFLEDWTKLLNGRGAKCEGGNQFPTAEQLARTDVLLIYCADGGDLNADQRASLTNFLARGGGLVTLLDGVCGHDPHWWKTVAGAAWEYNHTKWHYTKLTLRVRDTRHPITVGVADFGLDDEVYDGLHVVPEARVLAECEFLLRPATADAVAASKTIPQMWTLAKDNYRAFTWIQGLRVKTFDVPQYRALLLRGLAWAGKQTDVNQLCTQEELQSLGQ